ncbi:MAG: proton-conducting transporter membrane subunit [Eubacteriales bacterium]|nr:proton-conducting transporter membrane subunit [Eubacteriales bacterium]
MSVVILLAIFLPIIAGTVSLVQLAGKKNKDEEPSQEQLTKLHYNVARVLLITAALAIFAAWRSGSENGVTLFYLMKDIPLYFHIDDVGRLFVTFISIVWVLAGIYSFEYMKHEGKEQRFFGFYTIVFGVLIALCFAGNVVTLYLFYELMSLTTVPLVLHNGSRESIMAALKYLFYSMCGAYMGLFGIFFLYRYCDTLNFVAGGTLNTALASGNTKILLFAVFMMLVGFGVKAGMFPMHAWLPTAHPVAPSPASAVLSGIIVKCGVLSIIRVVYYMVGADFIRGTWVQTAWMTLTLITVFMGSLLAFKEKIFKKRLAYSTVSQASYILFGLAALQPQAMTGALLHSVFHAFIKSALFMTAGVFIYKCHRTRVEELPGVGREMPKTIWCYTFASLALIGIPPASGFISKWYLAEGALNAGIGAYGWIGPVVLLISALLTAGYLLPVTIKGFFPGDAAKESYENLEPSRLMLVPLAILAALTLLLGVFPNPLISFAGKIAASVM